MEEKQAGITALVTAYARAYHATHDSPLIFDDFRADQMYTEEEHASFNHHLAETLDLIDPELYATKPDQATALAQVMQRHNGPVTLSRSRYTEDCLEEAIRSGVQQYVILGAGFDTFAFRKTDHLNHIQVFEIDHPVTQEMKLQRIALAGWNVPEGLHFLPLDLNKSNLASALTQPAACKQSSYDPLKLSFFSWLGVTYYLPKEAIFTTLRDIAGIAAKGSAVIFDYMDADAFIPGKAGKRIQLMQSIARQVGEPMKTGFDSLWLAGDLGQRGFDLRENLSPSDIETRYFQGRKDHYHAFEHVHFARAVVK